MYQFFDKPRSLKSITDCLVAGGLVMALFTAGCAEPTPPPEEPAAETAGQMPAGTMGRVPAPEGARVYFVSPQDGATVSSPVTVQFGLSGMGVAPAGIDMANTGHHHLLIDVDSLPPMDQPVPADDNHRHFGGGQTEVEVELSPGQHTLQLLLGDMAHVPHDPPVMSEKITITVE